MSRINIHVVQAANGNPEGSDIVAELGLAPEPDHSLRDGEELMAVSEIIRLVDDLDNGEALVITRNVF
ncbi:hypothetical protein [Streptomyces sp. NPDC058280]|uniref:hypothetical protein n=1 Tax=Streptomyces sp. NPDC058280 TaxID=3346419 RepID=UPI0036E0B479